MVCTYLFADLRNDGGGGGDVSGVVKLLPLSANICGCLLNCVVNAPWRPATLRAFINFEKICNRYGNKYTTNYYYIKLRIVVNKYFIFFFF